LKSQKGRDCKKELYLYGYALAYELASQNIDDVNHRKSYDHIPLKLLVLKQADIAFLQQFSNNPNAILSPSVTHVCI